MLIKHVLTEKKSHIGGEAKFGYIHLPTHSELYLTKEIKQRFKVLGIPFKQTTSLETVQFPTEIVSLMVHATTLEGEGLEHMDFENYRTTTTQVARDLRLKTLQSVMQSEDLDQTQKEKMIANLRVDEDHVDMLFDDLDTVEKMKLTSFTKDGYEKVYRVWSGASATYYLAKVLDDRISFFIVEAMRFRDKGTRSYTLRLSNLRSFYMTQDFMKAFLEKVKEKGAIL